jgi:hypothetical protein
MRDLYVITDCAQAVTFRSTSSTVDEFGPITEQWSGTYYGESRTIDETPDACCRVMVGVPR